MLEGSKPTELRRSLPVPPPIPPLPSQGEARFPVSRVSQPTKNAGFSPGYEKLFNGAEEFAEFPTGGMGEK